MAQASGLWAAACFYKSRTFRRQLCPGGRKSHVALQKRGLALHLPAPAAKREGTGSAPGGTIGDGAVLESFGPDAWAWLRIRQRRVILLFQYQVDRVGRLRASTQLEILQGAFG